MVVDSSALIALLLGEPEAAAFAHAIADDTTRLLSAASLLETSMVIETKRGAAGGRELDLLVHRSTMAIVPVTHEQAELARAAWRRYGKGRHPAGLNFGDCFSYALSRHSGEPLLYKGADFSRTDVVSALRRE